MRLRPIVSWVLVCFVVVLCSSASAWSGVHLWRLEELFSNPDGTVQFIEMATCCGSAGGEIFLSGQTLRSNGRTFMFPGNLTTATPNKHILLATSAFTALPGAPAPDYIIPDNFFSIGGDTITFAVYDTMIFPAGALPTDGINSLNKDVEDSTDTTFTGRNSPTNLREQTGSVGGVSGPPGVPDGKGGTTPLTATPLVPDASTLRLSYDLASCTNAANHHILFGQGSGLPAAVGGVFRLLGGACNIGNTVPYDWVGVPTPDDGSYLIWFLVVATDSSGVEGSWGLDGSGGERLGPGNNGASGICAVTRNLANVCGHI